MDAPFKSPRKNSANHDSRTSEHAGIQISEKSRVIRELVCSNNAVQSRSESESNAKHEKKGKEIHSTYQNQALARVDAWLYFLNQSVLISEERR